MTIKELIIEKIKEKGSIDVGEFIQICQFENNGYYLRKNPIGRQNDFTTAPEISQMFGEILTIYLINYWEEKLMTKFNLIELGPGKGTLLNDLLRTASKNQEFLNAANITLIEKNKFLKKLQKDTVNYKNIKWSQEFSLSSSNIPSIIYSNEFFDCFPVRQFYKKNSWYEKLIQYNNYEKNFKFITKKVENNNILKALQKFNDVKVAEMSESRIKYFNLICKCIKKNRGIFITIDYGYKNLPNHLSLQTVYNHKNTHLFENIGNQDITSHVDFDELITVANKNNLKIDLFCTQKDFLINNGIKERKKNLQKNKSEEAIKNINLDYERLVSKSQMGEIFKVLVVSCC
tara:strand:- start:18 stop:1055 length:1038 start_codon:yes stop_codon:yes gene_type:complete